MGYAVQWLRSLGFIVSMYLAMLVIGILFFPWAVVSSRGARMACLAFCRWVRWSLDWMVGLRTEVRGEVPDDEVLIAAKHQSFLDIILIFGAVPAGKFIMKRELLWAPILGQYAYRIGCVPVDRGKRGAAIRKMAEDVAAGARVPGQLIIYSQGTRVAPGVKALYKVGTAVLYEQLGQECVPVATNVGVFWPRHGIYRKPGVAVVEFLPRIAAGIERGAFLARLEAEVEGASDALLVEAGFVARTACAVTSAAGIAPLPPFAAHLTEPAAPGRVLHVDRAVAAGQRGLAHRLGIGRVGVTGQRHVLRGRAELHRDAQLVDQIARHRADDMRAQDPVCFLVGDDLDEAVGGESSPWRGRSRGTRTCRPCRRARPSSTPPRSCRRSRPRDGCRSRPGSRRSSHAPPCRR